MDYANQQLQSKYLNLWYKWTRNRLKKRKLLKKLNEIKQKRLLAMSFRSIQQVLKLFINNE